MASAAVNLVINKLGQLAISEAKLVLGLKDDIEHVQMNLAWLLEFLADADQMQRHTQHRLVRLWVKQLREVAYNLEDVLDEYSVKLDVKRMGYAGWRAWLRNPRKARLFSGSEPWWKLSSLFYCGIYLFTRHHLASEISKINKRLKVISSNKSEYLVNIIDSMSVKESNTDMKINEIRTEVEEDPTGLKTYIEDLQKKLKHSEKKLLVISIFGMGGLGKTTLAKRLYNDEQVASNFTLRAWLTISQTFSPVDLLRSLMKQLKVEENQRAENAMKSNIKGHLSKERFLIVLDDIWEISALNYFNNIFPNEGEGNTVLLTTRFNDIATNLDSKPVELKHLSEEDSWTLFCKKAFADAICPDNFSEFRGVVYERCKGLPLAIIVLGGLLRKRKDPGQWRKFLNQSRWEKDELVSILGLSYDYLPHHLKACFLYVAGYPEDDDIPTDELMRMWIAEGIIQEEEGSTMEDLAEDYLEELMQRSLVQPAKRDDLGRVSVIRVHDLVVDMACKEAREINFLHRNISEQSSKHTRRLSLCNEDGMNKHFSCVPTYSTPKLRSLRVYFKGLEKKFPSEYFVFHSTKFLRVFSLPGIIFPDGKCPEEIGNMLQLRYLSFADTNLKELPNNIKNLQNLQTLDISGTYVSDMPVKFWKITSLRHVVAEDDFNLRIPSRQLDENNIKRKQQDDNTLKELQTLIGRPTYEWIANEGLKKLSNIRTLRLSMVPPQSGDSNSRAILLAEKLRNAIENLKHLSFLYLAEDLSSIEVLTASSKSLQCLELCHGHGNREKGLLKLDNQRHTLYINKFLQRKEDIDVIGGLHNLKSLTIEDEDVLEKLVFEGSSFSYLQELSLRLCFKLKCWEVKKNWSTTVLKLVQIDGCPELNTLPSEIHVQRIHLIDSGRPNRAQLQWREEAISKIQPGTNIE